MRFVLRSLTRPPPEFTFEVGYALGVVRECALVGALDRKIIVAGWRNMTITIRRLSYALGAEISGVDISKPLDAPMRREIRAAFLEYCVLLFRGRPLTREQHVAFGQQFGEVDMQDEVPKYQHPQYPQILVHKSSANGKVPDKYPGKIWHSDHCYRAAPAMATLLRGIEVPSVGGDTMFSNMYLAYEALSAGMKKLIANLHGVHYGGKARIDNSTQERIAETSRRAPPVAQPLARVHPETGRTTLFVGEKCKQIVGLNAEESMVLLKSLCQHAARPQFVYRHQWQKDDLLMWDNRCTNHIALNDYDQHQSRHMEKTTVKGTPSGYVYEGPLQYEGPRL